MTTYDVARPHRNKDPKWKVYIDSLPKTCQTAFVVTANTTLVNTTIFFELPRKEREQLDTRAVYSNELVLSRAWKKRYVTRLRSFQPQL